MDKEKILQNLKKRNDIKEIQEGEYISVFRRIGERKSSAKMLNLKPDFFIIYPDLSRDYVFFINDLFSAFNILSKLDVFFDMGAMPDYKSVIFYCKDSTLMINEEIGIINEKKTVMYSDSLDFIKNLSKKFGEKLGKKIEIIIE